MVQIKRFSSTDPDFNAKLDKLLAFENAQDDAIVDLVSSGNTLKANNLKAVEEIMPISSRLIINQAALKLKRDAIQPVLDAFSAAVNK